MSRRRFSHAFSFSIGLLLCACARPATIDRSPRDAGSEDTSSGRPAISVEPPAPPEEPELASAPTAPALPVFAPCPSGWREEEVPSVPAAGACAPWPSEQADACRQDGAHFPGEAGCVLIGTRCDPADDWAISLPSTGVLYVQTGAPRGGTGTRQAPFSTIAAAAAAASPGTIVAVGKGLFDEAIELGSGVTIWGACVAETILTTSAPAEAEGTITGIGSGGAVRNLRIGQSLRPGIVVRGEESTLRIEDALIEGTTIAAAVADGGAVLEGRTVVIRDTDGPGLVAIEGSRLEIDRLVVEGVLDSGVLMWDSREPLAAATRAVLSNAVIRGTRNGFGVEIQPRARLELGRAIIEATADSACSISGASASGRLTDVVLRNLTGGAALDVRDGASIEVERALIQEAGFSGVSLIGEGTSATMNDVIVHRVHGRTADREDGIGFLVAEGAKADLRRILVSRARTAGVGLYRPGTAAAIADLTVSETASPASIEAGYGIHVSERAQLDLQRADITRNRESGLLVERGPAESGVPSAPAGTTTARVTDLFVRETTGGGDPRADLLLGQGVTVHDSAVLEIERAWVERNRARGVVVSSSRFVARDIVVRATEGLPYPYGGLGLWVLGASEVDIGRFAAEENVLAGIRIEGDPELEPDAPPVVVLEDIVVRDTQPTAERYLGAGIVSQFAHLTVQRALFEHNHYAGVLIQGSTTETVLEEPVTLEDVVVRGTQISNDDRLSFFVTDFGYGLGVDFRAKVQVTRAIFEENQSGGVLALDSDVTLRDVVLRDSLPSSLGFFGRGLELGKGANAILERARIDRNLELGVAAFSGSRASLTDITVEDTKKNACDDPDCVSPEAAIGIGAYGGSNVRVHRFSIARNALCGLQLAQGGTIDLSDGEVREHRIGVNVQTEGFDLDRLKGNVLYIDNDLNLDAAQLPAPRARIPEL